MTTTQRRQDFYYSKLEEPHAERKRQIIEKYPQVAELMGPEPLTKWIILATVLLQITVAVLVKDASWPVFLLTAYIIGAVANQSLFLAIHELSHRLGSTSIVRNKLYQILANIPIGIPYASTFGPYHLEHHRYQGHDGIDVDIPTVAEGTFFSRLTYNYPMHCFMKAFFMFIQLGFYALRPMFVRPETLRTAQKDPFYIINQVVIIGADIALVYFAGFNALLYFWVSAFLAGSIHPVAGHFLAEHYVFEDEAQDGDHPHETYSYYGFWNYFTYNVGYHREHHDFPSVSWRNLPKIRAMAPEFYPEDGVTKSWVGTIVRFIFDDKVTPFSRVKREAIYHKKGGKDTTATAEETSDCGEKGSDAKVKQQ